MSATAFADDICLTGQADKLLELMPWITQLLKDRTGMEVVHTKTTLVPSGRRPADDEIYSTIQTMGIKSTTQGAIFMGIPWNS